jgi:hypothetical protein
MGDMASKIEREELEARMVEAELALENEEAEVEHELRVSVPPSLSASLVSWIPGLETQNFVLYIF